MSVLKNSKIRRTISMVLITALLFCTTVTDVNLFGVIHIDLGTKAEAATGEIDDTRLLDSSVVPDAVLLEFLKDEVQKVMPTVDRSAITVQNLAQKVREALIIPAGVRDLTGLGWARSASSFDMSACTLVTEIAEKEFYKCGMTTVKLPTSITKVGNNAFESCDALASINIQKVNYIGDGAFIGCAKLSDTSIATMKSEVEYLGSNAFQGCKAITEVKIPVITQTDLNHTVPIKLFSNCESLEKVYFCDANLTKVQDYAFEGTGILTFATTGTYTNKLPDTVNFIGEGAFMYSKVANLDLSSLAVAEIKDNTFAYASLSTNFLLPSKVTKLGVEAFAHSNIKKIIMPNTVTEIGEKCFQLAQGLEMVSLSKNIEEIPYEAFQAAGNGSVVSGSVPFVGESSYNLEISYTDADPVDSRLLRIGESAFNAAAVSDDSFLSGLTKLTDIGGNAFAASSFVTVTIPASVETMGIATFHACPILREVYFAAGSRLKELPDYCFGDSKKPGAQNGFNVIFSCIRLEKVQLPEQLETIGEYAFGNCYALQTVGCIGNMVEDEVNFPDTLLKLDDYAFFAASSYDTSNYAGVTKYFSGALLIPDGGIKKVTIPDSVMEIGVGAFKNNITLTEMNIGNGVKRIPNDFCQGCGAYPSKAREKDYLDASDVYTPIVFLGLKTLTMSDNVESIGANAFYQCYALESPAKWNLPIALATIEAKAFYDCKSLTNVVFNSGLTSIGADAFNGAAQGIDYSIKGPSKSYTYRKEFCGLTTLDFDFATKLETIGANAFKNTNLNKITFPSKVTLIPSGVCDGCYNLESVAGMSANVTSIGENAFRNCYKLDSVTIPFSAEWAATIFDGITANNNDKLSLNPAKSVENANVIKDRTTTLVLNCFKKFSTSYLMLAVTDADKSEDDPMNNLIENDTNDYVKVTSAASTIALFGKKYGQTGIKVSGKVKLYDAELNLHEVVLSISQKYNVNVTDLPIDTLNITSAGMAEVAGAKVQYLNIEKLAGLKFSAAYAPVDTTDKLEWSVDNPSIAGVSASTETSGKSEVTVMPIAIGDTVLKVASPSISDTCIVKVRVPSKTLKISSNKVALAKGDSYTLESEVIFDETKYGTISSDYRDVCKFTSSDTNVATVDYDTGRIIGVGKGTARITARCPVSGISQVCTVEVKDETATESLLIADSTLETEGATKVLYMNVDATAGKQISAAYLPIGTTETVTWSIDNSAVASLSATNPAMSNGKSTVTVRPVAAGDTVLHVKSGSLEDTCIVRVRVPASGLKLTQTSKTVATGSTYQLNPTITYAEKYQAMAAVYPDTCKYSSNNPFVAVVDENTGLITTVGEGSARITVKCSVSGRSATFTITVKNGYVPPVSSVKLSQSSLELCIGNQALLGATVLPEEADQQITWTSNNPSVVSVVGGVVKALKVGNATITATGAGNKRATCTVSVKSYAKGLKIKSSTGNTSKVYMKKKTSLTLGKYYTNMDCTDTFVFSAKKNKIGTVSASGTVKANKKTGKFTVNLTAYSGKKVTAKTKITVYVGKKDVKAKKVKISGSKKVKVNKRICLTAKLTSSKSTELVRWTSSKPAIATVDSYGVVKGVKKGKVKITAKTAGGKTKTIKITVKK